jgi:hypothetical protein
MSEPAPPAAANPETAFEPSDWAIRPVALALLGILFVVVIAVAVLAIEFATATSDVYRPLTVRMAEPRLQTNPAADLTGLRAREDRDLTAYYWVDRDKGIVHIPIEEAMKQIVARGLDGFPAGPPK